MLPVNRKLKYGLLMPHGGPSLNTPQKITDYAVMAEDAGWDGFFIWDSISKMAVDPWITMANIASKTTKIKFGPMVTPIARRRPWMIAKALISLDQLSDGRVIFGAGLGDDPVFDAIGELTSKKMRAEQFDEGLKVLDALLKGEKVSHKGEYYALKDVEFENGVQQPRIPIWMGGLWPAKAPFRRAAKWDGMMPHTVRSVTPGERLELDEVEEIMAYINDHRVGSMDDFDMVMLSYLPEDKKEAEELVKRYYNKGVSWWVESVHEWKAESMDELKRRIQVGPPEF